jgi:hypothetical protein
MTTESSRFQLTIGCLALYFVEGILKALLPSFPFVEAIAAEGAVAAYYLTTKTISNINKAKYENVCDDPAKSGAKL